MTEKNDNNILATLEVVTSSDRDQLLAEVRRSSEWTKVPSDDGNETFVSETKQKITFYEKTFSFSSM